MYVAMVGNLSGGYRAVGPFEDFEDAAQAMDFVECWIMTLESPADFVQGTQEEEE